MRYPIASWLVLEPSDTVVLVTYVLCGWPYAIICAILKAVIDILAFGLTGPFGIGQITAVITSFIYIGTLSICKLVFKKLNKSIVQRIASYAIIILAVSVIMTILNYIFITPTYLSWKFDTCFNPIYTGTIENPMLPYKGSLFVVCFLLYFPFNLIKGLIVCALFEILYITIIPYFKKLFETLTTRSNVVVTIEEENKGSNESNDKKEDLNQ